MTNWNATETDLLRAAKSGDSAAVNQLLERYRGYLTMLARRQTNRKLQLRVSASDLVQETLFDACRQIGQFRGRQPSELAAWLRTILARRLADQFRHHGAAKRDFRREQAIEGALYQSSVDIGRALADSTPCVSSQAAAAEQVVLLAAAIDQLPEDYREVIILREIERLSFADVAERLDRSTGAVRMLWVRALEKLRSNMGATDGL